MRDQKILIVDDNAVNQRILQNFLLANSYQCLIASSAIEAMLLIESHNFNLILLDISMPSMNGIDFCRILKSNDRTSEIPIIFLTTKSDKDTLVRAFEAGGEDYVTRPYDSNELLARVKSHLQINKLKTELQITVAELEHALEETDRLLNNTFPQYVIADYKSKGYTEPRQFDDVTLLVSDFVGFTEMSGRMTPQLLFDELNDLYSTFDRIMNENQCVRIKTIGDGYLAASGLPTPNSNHAQNIFDAAFRMREYLVQRNKQSSRQWQIRVGIHSGTVVGGVVGIERFVYDVFGSTVNMTFRLESVSEPMKIVVSEDTYQNIVSSRRFEKRLVNVKGVGDLPLYYF